MQRNIQSLHGVCIRHIQCTPVFFAPAILPVPQASDKGIPEVCLLATQNTDIPVLLLAFHAHFHFVFWINSIYWNGVRKVYKENPPALSISWVQIFFLLSCFHMQWWHSRGWICPGLWETSTDSSAADPVSFQCFPKAYPQVQWSLERNDIMVNIFSDLLHLFFQVEKVKKKKNHHHQQQKVVSKTAAQQIKILS